MPADHTRENPFLLPPPAPPERKTALRVVLALSTAFHLTLLAFAARAPKDALSPDHDAGETVRVLRGEVIGGAAEPGLRLLGYAEVRAPAPRARPPH